MADSDETNPPGLSEPATPSAAAAPWLDAIRDAEKAFRVYQEKCDSIDKQFADLERLASTTRDREFQLFWSNIGVLAPSIYSRPPIPVVIPRFKDQAELPRTASEILERTVVVTFGQDEGIDYPMRLIRDDLVISGRGVPWIRYDTTNKKKGKRVCIEHADRKDFLHGPARNWTEVPWVAKRSWLTQDAATARFKAKAKDLDYAVRKDAKSDTDDQKQKAGIWEIWHKEENKVVWVGEGCTTVLEQGEPHLDLENFFPCPRPAYSTVQRRTLVPVPDMVFYKDQLEEINDITARLAALTQAVQVRGFYPAGAGEVSDAIEAAMKSTSKNQQLVPVSNWAMMGNGNAKDMVLWWPTEIVTATITALIAIRKQLFDDVYQITGLSDIMRGETEASETLGAQQLKSNFGQVRIRDKQNELTRLACDVTRITAEIIAEHFDAETLMDMSQMRLPSDEDIRKQAAPLTQELEKIKKELPAAQQEMQGLQEQIQQAQSDPEIVAMAKANPDKAQQIVGAAQQHMQALQTQVQQMQQASQQIPVQLKALANTITIDKVMKLYRDQKLRPFILDIETDSTVAPDENASKQRATEFVTAVGGYLKESLPLVETMPPAAPVVAETLKYIVSQFRAGRSLEGTIDKFADAMKEKAEQPPPPNPEAIKAQTDAAETQAKTKREDATAQADVAAQQAQAQKDQAEAQATAADAQVKTLEAQTAAQDAELARKVLAQKELDASDARRADMAQKADLAALQIAMEHEKHQQALAKGEQELAKGALAIELQRHQVAHAQVATAAVAVKGEQDAAAGAQAMEHADKTHAQGMEHADAAAKAKLKKGAD